MMLSNLNLSSLPECNFEVRYVDSVLLNPCAEYQRLQSQDHLCVCGYGLSGCDPEAAAGPRHSKPSGCTG